jgi:ABC-type transport system involved in cytochrome bd biosynthesis fused ATPase/permease subunit
VGRLLSLSERPSELALTTAWPVTESSLLQGLIGEMRRVSGSVTFNGRVAYCPQSAWIMNATVRENVLFEEACLLRE